MAIDRPQVIASAEKLVARGKIEAAIKEYRKLLAENPNDASTLNRLGDLYARIDRIDEAVRLFSQIADRYTDDGFFVKAIAIYKKIIKLDPTRLAVYERLAELYHKQGLIPEARTQYQVLVDYYQKHSNPASAISVLQKMAILIPDDPAPHVKLAELFHSQQLTEKALAEYRLIADLMLRHNKVEEATQVYAKAIEAEPGDIAFITDAVLGLKDAGHVGAAARLLALAVERNPQAEKIARIAGLQRTPGAPAGEALPTPTAPLKVSDVTRGGGDSDEVLHLDPDLLATTEIARAAPAVDPVRSPPQSQSQPQAHPHPRPHPHPHPHPPVLRPVDEGEVDFVLELADDLDLPSTQVSPTDEMLQRSPESPWFEGGQEPEVEFDLDLEGLQSLAPVGAVAPPSALPPPETAQAIAPPATPASPPASLAPAAAAPVPSDEAYEIDWSFEPEPALDIPEVAPTATRTPVLNLEELERTSFEVLPTQVSGARRQDDLLAEAEVFRKYGLREKAHDRLRELLHINPRNIGANGLLVSLWIDEGKYDKALARANQLKRLAEEGKDESVWHQVRSRLVKAGFRVEGEEVVAPPTAVPKKKDKISALLDDLAGLSPSSGRSATKPAKARPAATAADLPVVPVVPAVPVVSNAAPPPASPTASTLPPTLAAPGPAIAKPPAPAPMAEAAPPPSAEAAAEPSAEPWHAGLHEAGPLDEELPEIVIPIARLPKTAVPLVSPAPPAPPAHPAQPPHPVTPERIAADESLSWLDQAVAAPAVHGGGDGEKLFDDEEGFFDLAAELEQELSKEDLLTGRDLMPTRRSSPSKRSSKDSSAASRRVSRRRTTTRITTSASLTARWGCSTRPSASSNSPRRSPGT